MSQVHIESDVSPTTITAQTSRIEQLKGILYTSDLSQVQLLKGQVIGQVIGSATGTLIGQLLGDLTGTAYGSLEGQISGNLHGPITGTFKGTYEGSGSGQLLGTVQGSATGQLIGSLDGPFTGSILGTVTGDVDASVITGQVYGEVTGPLTGDIDGEVRGSAQGTITGDVTGHLTGNILGNVLGLLYGDGVGTLVGDVHGQVQGTANGPILGNLVGQLQGNLIGDLVGNLTGHLTGNVIGQVLGNFSGSISSGNLIATTFQYEPSGVGFTGVLHSDALGVGHWFGAHDYLWAHTPVMSDGYLTLSNFVYGTEASSVSKPLHFSVRAYGLYQVHLTIPTFTGSVGDMLVLQWQVVADGTAIGAPWIASVLTVGTQAGGEVTGFYQPSSITQLGIKILYHKDGTIVLPNTTSGYVKNYL